MANSVALRLALQFLLLGIVVLVSQGKLAGECASICNDLRTEVLTLEMCREARKTLPRPKVGDFCLKAMEQGFSDSCVSLCMNEKPISRVAQTCRAAAVEMPRPTVRRWCEHGYNAAFQKTVSDLRDHFRVVMESETANVGISSVQSEDVTSTTATVSETSERLLQDISDSSGDSTESKQAVLATIPVTLDDVTRDLVVLEGQNAEEAVVVFCRQHMAGDVSSCIRQLLPVVLEKLDETSA